MIGQQEALLHFGKNVKALRLKRGLKLDGLDQLAERCDMDPHHLANIERGTKLVRLDTMLKISKGFGVPLATLVSGLEYDAFEASHATGQDSEWYALV